MRWHNGWLLVFPVIACNAAWAEVTASNAWARATAPGQKTGAAYVTLKSTDDAKVLGVTSSAAGRAELHTSMIMSGVASMHPVEGLKLPAGKAVELKPGADHIMLMELKHPLRHGDKLPLAITVEDKHGKRSTVQVEARVVPLVE